LQLLQVIDIEQAKRAAKIGKKYQNSEINGSEEIAASEFVWAFLGNCGIFLKHLLFCWLTEALLCL